MQLMQLVYLSVATQTMLDDNLRDILKVSRLNNEKHGITGMLLYRSPYFIQVLEGEESAVNKTYANIIVDPRHKDPVVLHRAQVSTREFDQWAMGFNHIDNISSKDFPGFSDFLEQPVGTEYFDKDNFGQVMMMLRAFRDRTSF